MMKEEPLVSIIMPSYNTVNFIGESIESVLAQTYQNWELLVVDDCSTDDSVSVIDSYGDSRIKSFVNEKNSGAAETRNRAIREAKGKYIAFLDSDDLWIPEKLQKQILFMEENGYVFTYHKHGFVNEKTELLPMELSGPKCVPKYGYYLFNWAGCLSVVYNAELVGLLQIENLKKRNDYAYWLKISKHHPCYLLEESLGLYRKREGSISNVSKWELIKSHYRLFRVSEGMSVLGSVFFTMVNIIFASYKKIRYIKKIKRCAGEN